MRLKLKGLFMLLIAFTMIIGNTFSEAYACDAQDAFPVALSSEGERIESADMGDDLVLLDSYTLPIQVVNTKNNEASATSSNSTVQEEVVADISIYQQTSTTKIYTKVTVRSSSWYSSLQISSFHCKVTYTNYTDFSIPTAIKTFTASSSNPSNSLSGSVLSAAQVSGHTIAVTVAISNIVVENVESWEASASNTYSTRVTIS